MELEKLASIYDVNEIIKIALENKLYGSLAIIFSPITIDGVTKMYYDVFLTGYCDMIYLLMKSFETIEMAILHAKAYSACSSLNNIELCGDNTEELK